MSTHGKPFYPFPPSFPVPSMYVRIVPKFWATYSPPPLLSFLPSPLPHGFSSLPVTISAEATSKVATGS